jgi:small subunit ribosomal protein S25
MPFKKGPAAWRRSLDYLKSGSLVFKEKVKVCSINYHETDASSDGLRRFIFWHLAQIQYKNPNVQCVQLKNIVKTPFITFHTQNEDGLIESINVNCYKKTDGEILDYCKNLIGNSIIVFAFSKQTMVVFFDALI